MEAPLELRLCESRMLILKPNQPYIFTVDPTCPMCVKIEREGKYEERVHKRNAGEGNSYR